MKFLATVCGGDVRWAVPVTTDDAQSMLATLMGHEPSEQALDTDVTHLLLVTRPEWAPAMRRLATLLRAQEPTLGVAVLETGHTPLAAAACVSEVHQHDLEPGAAARAVRDLLERTSSALWVRRPGPVQGARPSLWAVVRSWFSKTGYLATGADPVQVQLAEDAVWDELLDGADAFVQCGEMPERQSAQVGPRLDGRQIWSREVSPGSRVIVGRQRAVELALPRWLPGSAAVSGTPTQETCANCGASVRDYCAYCHAHWGRLPSPESPAAHFRADHVVANTREGGA